MLTQWTPPMPIDRIISMMVGRTIFESAPEVPEHPSDEIVLEARGLNRGATIRDVSFKLQEGARSWALPG
jgi:ribose transport system ATP-binding protein